MNEAGPVGPASFRIFALATDPDARSRHGIRHFATTVTFPVICG